MSSPVNLSDLPTASSASDGDLMLLRKGLTDFKINVSLIRNIDLSVLNSLMSPVASDLFYVQRTNQSYSVNFAKIGFSQSTKMWFYQGVAPSGWSIVSGTGDKLLGVADSSTQYSGVAYASVPAASGGSQGGTWLSAPHALTTDELPAHSHSIVTTIGGGDNSNGKPLRCGNQSDPINVNGGLAQPTGGDAAHDHGNLWRPLANVGIICNKDL